MQGVTLRPVTTVTSCYYEPWQGPMPSGIASELLANNGLEALELGVVGDVNPTPFRQALFNGLQITDPQGRISDLAAIKDKSVLPPVFRKVVDHGFRVFYTLSSRQPAESPLQFSVGFQSSPSFRTNLLPYTADGYTLTLKPGEYDFNLYSTSGYASLTVEWVKLFGAEGRELTLSEHRYSWAGESEYHLVKPCRTIEEFFSSGTGQTKFELVRNTNPANPMSHVLKNDPRRRGDPKWPWHGWYFIDYISAALDASGKVNEIDLTAVDLDAFMNLPQVPSYSRKFFLSAKRRPAERSERVLLIGSRVAGR